MKFALFFALFDYCVILQYPISFPVSFKSVRAIILWEGLIAVA